MSVTKWWWVRHAPVPDGGRIYGQADLPCDTTDRRVFEAISASLPQNAVWMTSTLQRTTQTAAAIIAASEGRHAPADIPAYAAFAERHFGDWQGRDRKAFLAERGMTPHTFMVSTANERPPGGETFGDLVARVVPLVRELTAKHRGRDIVAVTHGGTIQAAIGHALGLAPEQRHAFTIENCAITCLEHNTDGHWRISALNHRPWTGPVRTDVRF
jgi:broad specificity phosphatase PhoE